MKKIVIIALMLNTSVFAQVKKGTEVPNFNLDLLNNSPKSLMLSELKGKVVWLEFWATWCGPCISAMPHLVDLQQKYKDKLQVIAISNEPEKRIAQFLKAKPFDLAFAIDTADLLRKYFPYQLIPHSVLISADGKLINVTSPEKITSQVLDSILNGQEVHLEEKKDNLSTDYIKDYFYADDHVKHKILWQPPIKGAGGMMFSHLDKPAFSGRRLTFINASLTSIFSRAFGDIPYSRTIDSLGKLGDETFCLDIIVPKSDQLENTLRQELSKKYRVNAKMVTQQREVSVLSIIDQEKFAKVKRNTDGNRTYFARHGAIDQQGITLAAFAEFLESFGNLRRLVIDETANTEKLDLKFSFQPEDKNSLLQILDEMGLGLKQETRQINFLMLKNE